MPETNPQDLLTEGRRLLAGASELAWLQSGGSIIQQPNQGERAVRIATVHTDSNDAALIAFAVNNLPALLDAYEAQEKAKELLRGFDNPLRIEATETGWLIEWPVSPDAQPRWWHPEHGWTVDASRAIRYGRREDAEAAIKRGCFVKGVFASEHQWVTPRAALSDTKGAGHGTV